MITKIFAVILIVTTMVPSSIYWRWAYNGYSACKSRGGSFALFKAKDGAEMINYCGEAAQK